MLKPGDEVWIKATVGAYVEGGLYVGEHNVMPIEDVEALPVATHVIIDRARWERVRQAAAHVQAQYDAWDNDYNHPSGLPRDVIALNTIEQMVHMVEPGDLEPAT